MRGMLKGGGRLEAVSGIWKADTSDLGLSPTRTRVTATVLEFQAIGGPSPRSIQNQSRKWRSNPVRSDPNILEGLTVTVADDKSTCGHKIRKFNRSGGICHLVITY